MNIVSWIKEYLNASWALLFGGTWISSYLVEATKYVMVELGHHWRSGMTT